MAYNRVDDIAWLAVNGWISKEQDYTQHLGEIYRGLYLVGKAAGYSDDELAARSIPVDAIRAELRQLRTIARAAKRGR